MTTLKHLMIDLETMGVRPNAPIVSVGACFFNPDTGEIGAKFYKAVDIEDSFLLTKPDGGTVKWWMSQNDAARKAATAGNEKLADVLIALATFYSQGTKAQVWANGPSFDLVILDYGFHTALNQKTPWAFWDHRDVRTIVELSKGSVSKPSTFGNGTAHNALDDAIFQAGYVSKMWQALKGKTPPAPTVEDDDDLMGI